MRLLKFLLSFFSRTANIIAFILLLLSIAGAYVNPDVFWPFALFSLAYPFILLLNIFFTVSWIFRRRWFFLLSFVGILLSYPQLIAQWGFNYSPSKMESHAGTPIRIMSYNVRNFDLYDWSNSALTSQKMMDTIQKIQPDILFIQEYYTDTSFNNQKRLENLGYKFHYVAVELIKKEHHTWGVAIYSKHPIIRSGEIIRQKTPSPYKKFPHRGAFADILIEQDTIRALSVHLQSIYLGEQEYVALEELKKERTISSSGVLKIVGKLTKAYRLRGIQVEEMKDFIKSSPYPLVIGGDFNDTPSSYAYQSIARNMNDCFQEQGKGLGDTFSSRIPGLRIDYLFHSESFTCTYFSRIRFKASDHFPIYADLILNKH